MVNESYTWVGATAWVQKGPCFTLSKLVFSREERRFTKRFILIFQILHFVSFEGCFFFMFMSLNGGDRKLGALARHFSRGKEPLDGKTVITEWRFSRARSILSLP